MHRAVVGGRKGVERLRALDTGGGRPRDRVGGRQIDVANVAAIFCATDRPAASARRPDVEPGQPVPSQDAASQPPHS